MRQAARAFEFAFARPARRAMITAAHALARALAVILSGAKNFSDGSQEWWLSFRKALAVILSASGVLSACPQCEQRSRAKRSRMRWGAGAKNPSDSVSFCSSPGKSGCPILRVHAGAVPIPREEVARKHRPRSHGRVLIGTLVCALACAFATPARATIRYEISLARPAQHQFHVTMTIPGVTDIVTVQMPAWNALYQIRDFAYRVSDFRAFDDAGIAMTVRRLDKQTWRIEGPNRPLAGRSLIRIEYAIFWDDPGPFGTQLNDEHAFLNLAMVLCYVPERRGEDTFVH